MEAAVEEGGSMEAAVAVSTGVGSPAASMVEWAAAFMGAVCEAFMGEVLVASTPADLAGFTLAEFRAAAFVPVHRRAREREWIDWPAAHEKAAATP
jgi:hypothetical protein